MKNLLTIALLLFVSCMGKELEYKKLSETKNIIKKIDFSGNNKKTFNKLKNSIKSLKNEKMHSLLILKDGKLIFEHYGEDKNAMVDYEKYEHIKFDKDKKNMIFSSTKSIISTLTAIAIKEGFIKSLDESIINYLPEYDNVKHRDKKEIKIIDLLNMSSGLRFEEWSNRYTRFDKRNDWKKLNSSKDVLKFSMENKVLYKPGTHFNYAGSDVAIMAKIIERSANMSIEQFSKKYLFKPLNIDDVKWLKTAGGETAYDWGLMIKPRDFLKIGQLYLNRGVYNDIAIFDEDWVLNLQTPKFKKVMYGLGYKAFFWYPRFKVNDKLINCFTSWGYGGQHLFIFPDYNLAVVFNGGNWQHNKDLKIVYNKNKDIYPYIMLSQDILPKFVGEKVQYLGQYAN